MRSSLKGAISVVRYNIRLAKCAYKTKNSFYALYPHVNAV